jgi:hypothetical protein
LGLARGTDRRAIMILARSFGGIGGRSPYLMSEPEFDASLIKSIDEIYQASVAKV